MKLALLLLPLLIACATPATVVRAPATARGYVPAEADGLDAATEVQPRNRGDIFEQINGGSASFLQNGMVDAVFATLPRSGGGEYEVIELEVYRFADHAGALAQFDHLHGGDGKPWGSAVKAVVHDYGVEAIKGAIVVRVTFNDGPAEDMRAAAKSLATAVLARHP